MPIVFKEIQNLGEGSQPDLIHTPDNEAHILYTNDGKLFLQTTETPIGEWGDRELTDELGLNVDVDMDNFSINNLHGFGGVGSYSTPQSQYLLLYGTEKLDKVSYETIITSITHNYDDNQLGITISNKPYLNDDLNYLTNMWAKAQTASTYIDSNSDEWNYSAEKASEFENFINNPININNNNILIEQRDEFDELVQQAQITRRGIYMRDAENANGQMKIFSDKIVFTQDNWASYSVAIDSSGIRTSGNFKLISDNMYGGNNLVTIDGDGIKIYGSGEEGNGLEIYNKFNQRTVYLDSDGNANFTGVVTGGTIQTAKDGARIVLKDNELKSYNSSNQLSGLVSSPWTSLYTDLKIYSNGNNMLEFYDNIDGGITIRPVGSYNLYLGTGGKNTYAQGDWTFSSGSTITGLNTDSAGSHTHTVVVDGVTYTTSSSGSHTHNVKKS